MNRYPTRCRAASITSHRECDCGVRPPSTESEPSNRGWEPHTSSVELSESLRRDGSARSGVSLEASDANDGDRCAHGSAAHLSLRRFFLCRRYSVSRFSRLPRPLLGAQNRWPCARRPSTRRPCQRNEFAPAARRSPSSRARPKSSHRRANSRRRRNRVPSG